MTYHQPDNLLDALQIVADAPVRILAGGTDIYPAISGRELRAKILDITAIPDLSNITETEKYWRIGAAVKWSEIAKADLPPGFLALRQAALEIGSVQIQNSATLVGNICNASPAADGVPPLLIMDAIVEISSIRGVRTVELTAFIRGVREISLKPDEIVTAVLIPKTSANGVSAFQKFGVRKYLVISICMVAVRVVMKADEITEIAISVGACSPVAMRLTGLESALIGSASGKQRGMIEEHVTKVLSPIDDIRADAGSRVETAVSLIERAIRVAVA